MTYNFMSSVWIGDPVFVHRKVNECAPGTSGIWFSLFLFKTGYNTFIGGSFPKNLVATSVP